MTATGLTQTSFLSTRLQDCVNSGIWGLFLLSLAGLFTANPFQPLCFHEVPHCDQAWVQGQGRVVTAGTPRVFLGAPPNISIISLIISLQPTTNAWTFQGITGQQGTSYISKCRWFLKNTHLKRSLKCEGILFKGIS